MVAPQFDFGCLDGRLGEAVASGLIVIDLNPFEVLPGYWIMSGAIPYEGEVALAVADFKPPELPAGLARPEATAR